MSPPLPTILRPMSIGDLLDGAFTLYRKHFWTLLGIVAIATTPVLALEVVATLLFLPIDPLFTRGATSASNFSTPQLAALAGGGVLFLIAALFGGLAAIFETGALAIFISEQYLGRQLSARQAYAHALRRWPSLLGMSLIFLMVYGGLFVVMFIPLALLVFASGSGNSGLPLFISCTVCLLLPLILITYYALSVRWQFAPQAIVIEQRGALEGLRRSWNLVRGSFWRVAGIALVLTIMITILSSAASFSLQFIVFALPSFVLINALSTIMTNLLQMIVLPLQFGTLTLLYYDLRVRREGFDLQQMADQLAPAPAAA